MKEQLKTPDVRMLQLMEWAIAHGKAVTETEYLKAIGFSAPNISNVRRGHQVFTRDQITAACVLTGANANWILGIESNMMRKPAKTALESLEQAVASIKAELSEKVKGPAKLMLQYSAQ